MTFSTDELEAVFRLSGDAIIGLLDNRVILANPRARELFGDIVGEGAERFLPQDTSDDSGEAPLSREIDGLSYSVCSARVDGLCLLSFSAPKKDTDAALASLSGSVFGQINSSLLSIRAASERIIEVGEFGGLSFGYYKNILYRSIFQLQRLSQNLALLSGIGSGNLQLERSTTDLSELVGKLVDSVSHFFPGLIEFKPDPGSSRDIPAYVDGERLSQTLLNILSNSLAHAGEGAHITVSLKMSGKRITLGVDDNCGGMSPLALSRVFSKYSGDLSLSSISDGAGLGLAVAKGVIEAHGGALMIESREGKGTLVRIMLPVSDHSMINSPGRFFSSGGGMEPILTGLSNVLPREFYCEKYMD